MSATSAIGWTVAGSAVVAVSQMYGKRATDEIHPIQLCFLRFGLAAPFCYGLNVFFTHRWIPSATSGELWLSVLVGFVGWVAGAILFYIAMQLDSMHRVATICSSISVWAAVMSIVFLGEPLFMAMIAALALLTVGIVLMAPVAKETKKWRWAIPVSVLVSVLWALSIVLTKVALGSLDVTTFVLIKLVAATLCHLAILPFLKQRFTANGVKNGFLSAATLVAGDLFLMLGVQGLPASVFSPIFATTIPFGFIVSVIFLGEHPMGRNWLGMALIFAAAALCGYYGTM